MYICIYVHTHIYKMCVYTHTHIYIYIYVCQNSATKTSKLPITCEHVSEGLRAPPGRWMGPTAPSDPEATMKPQIRHLLLVEFLAL